MDNIPTFERQKDWYDPETQPNPPIVIIGVGGIGSPTAEGLARLGINNLILVDPDTISLHNVANQMFFRDEVGKLKVDVLEERLSKLGASVVKFPDYIQNAPNALMFESIAISAVDNMLTRKQIFEVAESSPLRILIDARLAGQTLEILVVDLKSEEDKKAYKSTYLFSDEEATPLSCTAAGIADMMFMVSGLITQTVRNILTERLVTFRTVYDHFNRVFYHFNSMGLEVDITDSEEIQIIQEEEPNVSDSRTPENTDSQ